MVEVAPVGNLLASGDTLAQLLLVVCKIIGAELDRAENPVVELSRNPSPERSARRVCYLAGERLIWHVLPYPGSDCKVDAALSGELHKPFDRVLPVAAASGSPGAASCRG